MSGLDECITIEPCSNCRERVLADRYWVLMSNNVRVLGYLNYTHDYIKRHGILNLRVARNIIYSLKGKYYLKCYSCGHTIRPDNPLYKKYERVIEYYLKTSKE